jgi:hypothetical protein
MNRAEPPVIANGMIFAYGNGEDTAQASFDTGLAYNSAENRIKGSTHAVLYALDGPPRQGSDRQRWVERRLPLRQNRSLRIVFGSYGGSWLARTMAA